jgi:hypothetical protein
MVFGITDDVFERERHRLTMFFEARAEEMNLKSGRIDWLVKDMNLCARLWDGRCGDRWIHIDLRLGEVVHGFTKTIDLDDEIFDLLTLFFSPTDISLETAWAFHRAWLYDRISLAEMQIQLKTLRPPS